MSSHPSHALPSSSDQQRHSFPHVLSSNQQSYQSLGRDFAQNNFPNPHQWTSSPVQPPYQSVHPVDFYPQANTMDGARALPGETLSGGGLAGSMARYMRDKCERERNRERNEKQVVCDRAPIPPGSNFVDHGGAAYHSKVTPWSAQTQFSQPSNSAQYSAGYVCHQYQVPHLDYPPASNHNIHTQTPHLDHTRQLHYNHVTQPNLVIPQYSSSQTTNPAHVHHNQIVQDPTHQIYQPGYHMPPALEHTEYEPGVYVGRDYVGQMQPGPQTAHLMHSSESYPPILTQQAHYHAGPEPPGPELVSVGGVNVELPERNSHNTGIGTHNRGVKEVIAGKTGLREFAYGQSPSNGGSWERNNNPPLFNDRSTIGQSPAAPGASAGFVEKQRDYTREVPGKPRRNALLAGISLREKVNGEQGDHTRVMSDEAYRPTLLTAVKSSAAGMDEGNRIREQNGIGGQTLSESIPKRSERNGMNTVGMETAKLQRNPAVNLTENGKNEKTNTKRGILVERERLAEYKGEEKQIKVMEHIPGMTEETVGVDHHLHSTQSSDSVDIREVQKKSVIEGGGKAPGLGCGEGRKNMIDLNGIEKCRNGNMGGKNDVLLPDESSRDYIDVDADIEREKRFKEFELPIGAREMPSKGTKEGKSKKDIGTLGRGESGALVGKMRRPVMVSMFDSDSDTEDDENSQKKAMKKRSVGNRGKGKKVSKADNRQIARGGGHLKNTERKKRDMTLFGDDASDFEDTMRKSRASKQRPGRSKSANQSQENTLRRSKRTRRQTTKGKESRLCTEQGDDDDEHEEKMPRRKRPRRSSSERRRSNNLNGNDCDSDMDEDWKSSQEKGSMKKRGKPRNVKSRDSSQATNDVDGGSQSQSQSQPLQIDVVDMSRKRVRKVQKNKYCHFQYTRLDEDDAYEIRRSFQEKYPPPPNNMALQAQYEAKHGIRVTPAIKKMLWEKKLKPWSDRWYELFGLWGDVARKIKSDKEPRGKKPNLNATELKVAMRGFFKEHGPIDVDATKLTALDSANG